MNTSIEVAGKPHEKSWLIGTREGQALLKDAKDSLSRPRCRCSKNLPEMYISRRANHFYLSKMPGSSNEHAEDCQAHIAEIFTEQSESDELTAGQLLQKVWDFVMDKGGPAQPFWYATQRSVLEAARVMRADDKPFADHLLVPEQFRVTVADQLNATYGAFYARQAADRDKQVRYWTLGMLKDIVDRQYSYQVTLKHMPSTKFWVHKNLFEIFPPLPCPEGQMVACLFSCRRTPSGVEVDEAATLLLNDKYQTMEWEISPLLPSAPSDQQVEQARVKLGLPASAGRDAVFCKLVEQLLQKQ